MFSPSPSPSPCRMRATHKKNKNRLSIVYIYLAVNGPPRKGLEKTLARCGVWVRLARCGMGQDRTRFVTGRVGGFGCMDSHSIAGALLLCSNQSGGGGGRLGKTSTCLQCTCRQLSGMSCYKYCQCSDLDDVEAWSEVNVNRTRLLKIGTGGAMWHGYGVIY